jgi:CDP-diacylglycerol--serine O-phosphatidyltransferase
MWQLAVYLMIAASIFDFLDGFAARMLNAYSETGKQLDSLADMVTFGVLPAVFIYTIFKSQPLNTSPLYWGMLASIVVVPAFSAIRLARFNVKEPVDAEDFQSEEDPDAATKPGESFFQGLPTPAHALFWTGLFWQFMQDGLLFGTPLNLFFLWAIMLIMAFHMILPVPMYTLKFKHFRVRGNLIRYLIIMVAAVILVFTGLSGLSLVILTYILLSLLNLLLQARVSK